MKEMWTCKDRTHEAAAKRTPELMARGPSGGGQRSALGAGKCRRARGRETRAGGQGAQSPSKWSLGWLGASVRNRVQVRERSSVGPGGAGAQPWGDASWEEQRGCSGTTRASGREEGRGSGPRPGWALCKFPHDS